jgi:hypothetical protein
MDLERLQDEPLAADFQVISIGDQLAWVGLPGEIFVDLGLAIKQGSPFPHTIVSGMSASGTISYVPTSKSFAEGSYEVISARIAAGGGEALADSAVQLLKDIFPARESGGTTVIDFAGRISPGNSTGQVRRPVADSERA